jgi:hypothetical protein
MKKVLFFLFLLAVPVLVYPQRPTAGEISLCFNSSVEGTQAVDILQEAGVPLVDQPRMVTPTIWFKVEPGKHQEFEKALSDSRLFVTSPLVHYEKLSSGEEVIGYCLKWTTTKSDVDKFLVGKPCKHIASAQHYGINGTLKVPEGKEKEYVEKLHKNKNVYQADVCWKEQVIE